MKLIDDILLQSKTMVDKVDDFAEGKDLDNSITIETNDDKAGDKLLQTGDHPSNPDVLIEEKDKVFDSQMKESQVPVDLATPPSSSLATGALNAADTCDDSMMAAILQSEFNRELQNNKPKQAIKAEPPKKQEPMKESTLADIQKCQYVEKMDKLTGVQLKFKDNLAALMNMGFCDFSKNLTLLSENGKNDLEYALEKLCEV